MYALLMLATAMFTFLAAVAIFAGGAVSGLSKLVMRTQRSDDKPTLVKVQAR